MRYSLQRCIFAAEDLPQQLLCQLVATLLVHADAASSAELQQAMRDLCQLTQRRIDGLHLTKMMAGFADAQAAVATATAAAQGGTSSKASTSQGTRRRSTAAADAEITPKLTAVAEMTAAPAVYMTPAVPKSRSRLGLIASASARKPQSRLKALQKSSSKAAAAAAADDDGISGLAGLMATKLQLAADEDEEDKENAQDNAAVGDGCSAKAAEAVLQPGAAAKLRQPQRAASAAAGGRRVRFAAEAEQDEGQQPVAMLTSSCAADDDTYEHLVVPQSLARHAVRRSRLSEGQGCLKAATAAAAGASSSSSRRLAKPTTAASGGDSDVSSAAEPHADATTGRSQTGTAAAASRQQRQQRAWVPSVLLLLDGQVQQLPWESCQGLASQNMYRCA
jgi:hypothetical protein